MRQDETLWSVLTFKFTTMNNSIIFICSMSIDNGKPFNTIEDALNYLYQRIYHAKLHLNAKLQDMKVDENSFTITVEQYDCFRGTSVVEYKIKNTTEKDAEIIRNYLQINL